MIEMIKIVRLVRTKLNTFTIINFLR